MVSNKRFKPVLIFFLLISAGCKADSSDVLSLVERCIGYEVLKQWSELYDCRDSSFKATVDELFFINKYQKESKNLLLEGFSVDSVMEIGGQFSVSIVYEYTFLNSGQKIRFKDRVQAINEEGRWCLVDLGRYMFFPLNQKISENGEIKAIKGSE